MSFVVLREDILTQTNIINLIADLQQRAMAATQTRRRCAAHLEQPYRPLVPTLPGGSVPEAGSALTHRHTLSLPPSVMDYGRRGMNCRTQWNNVRLAGKAASLRNEWLPFQTGTNGGTSAAVVFSAANSLLANGQNVPL